MAVAPARELDADAVPLPLGGERLRLELVEILEVLDRVREHRRAERRRIAALGPLASSLDPGEQPGIGRLQAVPDLLHRVRLVAAERAHRGLGEPRRNADAQVAGHELEECPAPGLVEGVEPVREMARQLALRGAGQRLHDLREGGDGGGRVVVAGPGSIPLPRRRGESAVGRARRSATARGLTRRRLVLSRPLIRAAAPRAGHKIVAPLFPRAGREGGVQRFPRPRPDQRRGLGQIADVVVREREQDRIDPLLHEAPDQRRLGLAEGETAGHGGQRPAALGIGRAGKKILEQAQLGVAARLVGESVEKVGEVVHAEASSIFGSCPGSGSASPSSP